VGGEVHVRTGDGAVRVLSVRIEESEDEAVGTVLRGAAIARLVPRS
jgi:hypothetical protein